MSWLSKIPTKVSQDANEFQLENVIFGAEIGEGAVGRVYQGTFVDRLVAIKQFKKTSAYSDCMLLREAKFLRRVGNHVNIVQFQGCVLEKRALVFELCVVEIDGGRFNDLKSILGIMSKIPDGQQPLEPRVHFINDIVTGIQFIHSQDIVHCDLKPQNVLVTGAAEHMICKLTDFGSYCNIQTHYSLVSTSGVRIHGTAPYMAPEICPPCPSHIKSSKETDVYALGMTIYEILMPNVTFPWCNELSSTSLRDPTTIYVAVKDGKRPCLEKIPTFYSASQISVLIKLAELVTSCWQQSAHTRPTASYVLGQVESLLPSNAIRQSPRLTPQKQHSSAKIIAMKTPRKLFENSPSAVSANKQDLEIPSTEMQWEKNVLHIPEPQSEIFDNREDNLKELMAISSAGLSSVQEQNSICTLTQTLSHKSVIDDVGNAPSHSQSISKANVAPLLGSQVDLFDTDEEEFQAAITKSFVSSPYQDNDVSEVPVSKVNNSHPAPTNEKQASGKELAGKDLASVENVQTLQKSSTNSSQKVVHPVHQQDDVVAIASRLNIEQLQTFQWQTINKLLEGLSVLLTSKCGSGKSLCFIIPAIFFHRNHQKFTLVVEPSVTLIQEQTESLQAKGIDAVALGSPAGQTARSVSYQRLFQPDKIPVLAYCTPEYLFGKTGSFQKLDQVFKNSLAMLVIDEAHKATDRRKSFRGAYSELQVINNTYDVPVLCCSASLTRSWIEDLLHNYLPLGTNKILKPIKRNHVKIQFQRYTRTKPSQKACSSHDVEEGMENMLSTVPEKGYSWSTVIAEITEAVKNNVAICFVDYQKDAQKIALDLSNRGVKARFLVGGNMQSDEKRTASNAFKSGEDNVLVATETYECGMHNENCSKVIRIGCARNCAVIVQELGRVGRNKENGEFNYLWNEFHDDQRLANWVKPVGSRKAEIDKEDEEVKVIIHSFVTSWRFLYSHLIGMCSHQALSTFFDDSADDLSPIQHCKMEGCMCDSCNTDHTLVDVSSMIVTMLVALKDALQYEKKFTMRYFSCFLMQSSIKWLRERTDLVRLKSFGCAADWPNVSMEGLFNLIRICICLGYINLDYDFFSLSDGTTRSYRRLSLSESGGEYCDNIHKVTVPDPFNTGDTKRLKDNKEKKNRRSISQVGLPVVKRMLKEPEKWLTISDEKQYRALGFGGETFPFLYYVESWKAMKAASTRDFLRNDLQMTKGSGQSAQKCSHEVKIRDETEKVVIKINKCQGCKKCPVEDCYVGFTNYARFNECVVHKNDHRTVVTCGDNCPVSFIYVYPKDEADLRQWFGCVSRKPTGHNHPSPIDWKLMSRTKHDIRAAQISNPYGKPKDFQKGVGMEYEPMLVDPAATHSGRISRELSRTVGIVGAGKFRTLNILENFNNIRVDIENKTDPELVHEETKEELDKEMGTYAAKDHCVMIGDQLYGFFAANWQTKCLSQATHIFVDICYIRNKELPGLLNIVAPCAELKCYVPVYRIFLNKQDAAAIAFVIETTFKNVDKQYSQFKMGSKIEQLMVDFSDAEENGLRIALGDQLVDKVIRGCKFHFMQTTEKVATLVTETDCQKRLFVHLARKIPDCKDKENVMLIFKVLSGEAQPSQVLELITIEALKDSAILINNKSWEGAATWVNWWLRPNHLRKVSLAFTGLSEETWVSSQGTNNPVESINRVSKTQSLCGVREALQHIFYEDRRTAFLLVSVRAGRSVTYRHQTTTRRKRKYTSMGDSLNPPDTKSKLQRKKLPRGEKAVNHQVEVEYYIDEEKTTKKWFRGKVIMYNKSRGYLIRFNDYGPEGDTWEKSIGADDIRFID